MNELPPTHSSHAILSTDAEGRVTAVSADAADVFGKGVEELIGRFVTDLVAPADVPTLADAYRATLEGGGSTTVRLHIPSGHGVPLAFEATAFAIRDAVGRAPALTLSLRRTEGRDDARNDVGGPESARLQTVVDGAQLGTWDWHLPSGAVHFNARWAEMLGYRLDEITPDVSSWERLVHPDDLPGVMEVLTEHLEGRMEIYSTEHRMLHKEGHSVWIQDVGRVFERDDEGNPIRAAGIRLDITARMNAEAAARQHLAKFQSLFESQPMGVAVTDPEGNLVEVNHAAEEILGLNMAEQTSREIDGDEGAILRPDGSPMPTEEFASVVALREGRRVDGSEMAVRRPDGSWRWLSVSAAPVEHADYGVIISYTDVTEIKTQEARYRTIFNSIDDVIFTLDEEHRYTEILADRHDAWREVLGERPENLIGRRRTDLVGDEAEHDAAVDRAFAGESVVYEWTLPSPRPFRRIQTALSRIVDSAGQVTGVVGVARDITARVELEKARVEMEKRTMELQKAESLAALAGGVAHDFNNLLSGVLLNAELAAGEVGPTSRAHDLIDDIVSAAESASTLSRQMLAYSGGGRILVERIEPGDLLRSMRSSVATRLGAETTFHLHIADSLPPIQADATQVWQALYNVILNASDALQGRPGDISVQVDAVRMDQIPEGLEGDRAHLNGETFVRFSVTDSGEGVPDGVAERLFEPFFTTKFAGRGLGLSAVLGITRAHGGAILFDKATDAGAAFHLFFPALKEEGAVPLAQTAREPEAPAPTVLVVDDEEVVRKAGRRLLEALGYRVLEAEDGDLALEVWQAHRGEVDLVILDMTMPRLDGCDTLAQLREWAPDLRVLMTSGYSEREVLARSKDHTPDGFIPKPFRLKQVQDSIESVLAH